MSLSLFFSVLFCVPAYAVDASVPFDASAGDADWIAPKLDFTDALYGSNTFTVYGSMTRYKLDDNDLGLYDYTRDVTQSFGSSSESVRPSFSGSVYRIYIPTPPYASFPYNHFETDQRTYYELYDYPQFSFKGSAVWFFSDLYLDPGFYEIDTTCILGLYCFLPGSGWQYFRPTVFEVGLENSGRLTLISQSPSDRAQFILEVKDRSRVYFSASSSSQIVPYSVSEPVSSWRDFLRWDLSPPVFKYRSIPQADVAALQAAVDDSNNSQASYDSVEAEWTGSMTDNFNSLNIDSFRFDAGLISAFTLVSNLFSRIWAAMGDFAILYTFPLYLGIVLLLIGRISKFAGGQSSASSKRGDDDA